MRSYKSPGNKLRLHHVGDDRGIVNIDNERDYKFVYVLEDNFGNKSRYRFTVRGKRQDIPEYHMKGEELLQSSHTAIIQRPGMEFIIPKGMLYDDTEVSVGITAEVLALQPKTQQPFRLNMTLMQETLRFTVIVLWL